MAGDETRGPRTPRSATPRTAGRGGTPPTHTGTSTAAQIAARRRAAVLLCLLTLTTVTWLLALLPGVPWWIAFVPTLLLVLDLVALRLTARQRALREARNRRPTQGTRRRPQGASVTAPVPPAAGTADELDTAPQEASEPPAAAEPPSQGREQDADGEDTWTPVPVPPPTYTLKPMAPRPGNDPVREDAAVRQAEPPKVEDQVVAATAVTVPPDGLTPPAQTPAVARAQSRAAGERTGPQEVVDLRTIDLRGAFVDLRTQAGPVAGPAAPQGNGAGNGGAEESAGDRAVHELDLDAVLERRRAVNS